MVPRITFDWQAFARSLRSRYTIFPFDRNPHRDADLYTTILFDLDETLYPRSAGLMQEISARISRYLIERMGYSPEEAQAKKLHYYHAYGTSLRGLMAEETVDVEDYLSYVHDIDVARYVGPNPDLDAMLRSIPLAKVVFTNATQEHARRVLDLLGIAEHFPFVIDIRAMALVNKPDPRAYRRILELIGAQAGECIIVEDTPRNLLPAKALGMKTILVDHAECGEVDFCVPDILGVGDVVKRLTESEDGRGRSKRET
jgi:putative hydrolase of the HAD superfamily